LAVTGTYETLAAYAVFAAVALGFAGNTFLTTPGPALVGSLSIAAGVPVYFIWKRER
jgi:hypothetical protein